MEGIPGEERAEERVPDRQGPDRFPGARRSRAPRHHQGGGLRRRALTLARITNGLRRAAQPMA
ncbi:protein of unknown function [Cupriavidus taiwanensis]|uniref:Uncharacterized protein n=1 Tax=Cupriavidus taiwanensis TaxID=164546 RepID=A0A7Z7JD71_9BURK|nr:protein of unknown function [Cupriavidus taiwanensis]SPC22847.1 protein of unknown function [Cupriavidus taiwanensis]